MSDNTTFHYHGDRAGPTGVFDFEVEVGGPVTPDADFIVIGHGSDKTLTLTGVSRWDAKAQEWVDAALSDAPQGWEAMVRDAQDADAEDAHERFLSDFYGGSTPRTDKERHDALMGEVDGYK